MSIFTNTALINSQTVYLSLRSSRWTNKAKRRCLSTTQSSCPYNCLGSQRGGHLLSSTSRVSSRLYSSSSPSPAPLSTPLETTTTSTGSSSNESYDEDYDDEDEDDPEIVLILAACAVGVATGASVVAFNDAIHFIRDGIWQGETLLTGRELLKKFSEFELWPRIVFPPVLGGVFVGLLGLLINGYADPQSTAPSGREEGKASTDDVEVEWRRRIDSVTRPISRAVAAAVTLGTGASLGPEGPSVDIGRSFAKALSTMFKYPQKHLTSLIAAGSGAGVAAGFNAPIAGVFFAVETVLQRQLLRAVASSSETGAKQAQKEAQAMQDSSALTIAMVLLASVLAAVVSQAGLGSSPAFRVPEYRLQSMYELPLYIVFGALCGAVSSSFSYSARVAEEAFNELRQGADGPAGVASKALLPALGGLTTGVLALGYPEILYQGFDNVSSILSSNGEYPPGLLVQIVVLKIIATTISRGSGLQGGLYAPSIFIGASLGSAFGLFVHGVGDPSGLLLSAPQAYALVGVGAMLASNCGVPLTSILLLFELTRDYLIIVPAIAAVGISFWISSLAAPGVTNATTRKRRRRQRAAALAAASAVTNPSDSALLDSIKERLLDGVLLQEGVNGPVDITSDAEISVDGSTNNGTNMDSTTGESLLLACAVDRGCLLLRDDMSLSQALALMESEQTSAAVIISNGGGVLGVVSTKVPRDMMEAINSGSESENET